MMADMQEVAALQRSLQMEEMQLFHNYRMSSVLRSASRQHVQDAYAKEYQVLQVLGRLRSEEVEVDQFSNEAKELATQGQKDETKASSYDTASVSDRLEYVSSKLKGTSLEEEAQKEVEEANERLMKADELERQGFSRLHKAEAQLNGTAADSNSTTLSEVVASDRGICQWLPWACQRVENSTPMDPNKRVSDQAISLANEIHESLRLIDEAKRDRADAVELLHKSFEDVNHSIALLELASELHEKADEEHLEAVTLHKQAKIEKAEAEEDEIIGTVINEEIVLDKEILIADLNAMTRLVVEAKEEAQNATDLDSKSKDEQSWIAETDLRIRSTTFAAKKQVTHAGWIALLAVFLSIVLCCLMARRIINAFETNGPLAWILASPKLEIRDISFTFLHILLLLLTLAFSGELLYGYHMRGILARVEIVTLFALAGSFFQVTALHFLPNVIRLIFLSRLNWRTFTTLIVENVGKSSVVVFAVFILEILLVWVNFGSFVFDHVYKWNRVWLWGMTTIVGLLHVICFEKYESSDARPVSDESIMNPAGCEEGTELVSLESGSGSTPASFESIDLSKSGSRTSSVSYGSTSDTSSNTFSPEIEATFISSWSFQLARLLVPFDFLLACWAMWVARHNITIIFNLSPISAGIVWGFFPMWVMGVVLVLSLIATVFGYCSWLRKKRLERPSDVASTGLSPRQDLSTTPLIG